MSAGENPSVFALEFTMRRTNCHPITPPNCTTCGTQWLDVPECFDSQEQSNLVSHEQKSKGFSFCKGTVVDASIPRDCQSHEPREPNAISRGMELSLCFYALSQFCLFASLSSSHHQRLTQASFALLCGIPDTTIMLPEPLVMESYRGDLVSLSCARDPFLRHSYPCWRQGNFGYNSSLVFLVSVSTAIPGHHYPASLIDITIQRLPHHQ